MLDLCNIVNTRPIYARKLSNFAVVPHKRDVGLNIHDIIRKRYSTVVLHKRDVGLNYKLQNHVADWLKVVPRKRNVGLNGCE